MPLIFLTTNNEFLSLTSNYFIKTEGGQVVFKGGVRSVNHGQEVDHLFYETHVELAEKIFSDVERAAHAQFPITKSMAFHRLGRVEVGEEAVVIAVLAPHRHEAFLATRFLIDELKRNVPIWKKEVYKNGSHVWDQPCVLHTQKVDEKIRPVQVALQAKGISPDLLENQRVLLVGAGGLGCPLAINLMGLNVKKLTIYDGDRVSKSNLMRQFIYRESDEGLLKANVIKQFLMARHPEAVIDARPVFLERKEACDIVRDFDLIIDATDNKNTKVMLKEIAWTEGIFLISASVHQLQGEVQSFSPRSNACLLCFSATDESFLDGTCTQRGVLSHVCAMVASVAIEKSLKLLFGDNNSCEITLIDPGGFIKTISIKKDRYCRVCGTPRYDSQKKLVRLVR